MSELSPPSEDDSVDDGLSPVVESMSSTPIPFTFSNVKSELVDVLKYDFIALHPESHHDKLYH